MQEFFWWLTVLPCESVATEAHSWALTLDLPQKWHQITQDKVHTRKAPLLPGKSNLATIEHIIEWHKIFST